MVDVIVSRLHFKDIISMNLCEALLGRIGRAVQGTAGESRHRRQRHENRASEKLHDLAFLVKKPKVNPQLFKLSQFNSRDKRLSKSFRFFNAVRRKVLPADLRQVTPAAYAPAPGADKPSSDRALRHST